MRKEQEVIIEKNRTELLERIASKVYMVRMLPEADITMQEIADCEMMPVEYIDWLWNLTQTYLDKDNEAVAEIALKEMKDEFLECELRTLEHSINMHEFFQKKTVELAMWRKVILYGLQNGLPVDDIVRITKLEREMVIKVANEFFNEEQK